MGEKCSISIDGPPSALVADTDTTYLIFGGAAVFLILCIITVSIVLCRKWSVAKYDTGSVNRVPEVNNRPPGSTAGGNMIPLSGPMSGPHTSSSANTDLNSLNNIKSNSNTLKNDLQSLQSNNNGFTVNGINNRNNVIDSEPVYATTVAAQHKAVDNRPSYEVWEMEPPPPPPMYRRVPPPTHMMTLDRRIHGGGHGLQHHLVPNGCDLTLNRRHFNTEHQRVRTRRHADDLWLV